MNWHFVHEVMNTLLDNRISEQLIKDDHNKKNLQAINWHFIPLTRCVCPYMTYLLLFESIFILKL